MGTLTETQLTAHIKGEKPAGLYYFYGSDTASVAKYAEAVKVKVLGKGYTSSDFTKYDGKGFSVSDFIDTAQMFSMCSDYNFIAVNDLNADELGADELKMLIKALESIASETVVLIYITGFDVKNGKKTPGAKNKKIIDAAGKNGIVYEAMIKKPAELSKYIMDLVKNNGCIISRQDAQLIAERCHSDTLAVINQTDMLCSYAQGSEITAQMIEAMVPAALDTNAFALASAVTSFNTRSALRILDELMLERTEAVVIISALSSAFIDLYRARTAIEKSLSDSDMASDFNYRGREFVVRNAFRDASKTSLNHLRRCLLILRNADAQCKSTRLDQKTIIEKAVITMLSYKD
ncbi:MAG: DNA polymerase III subunit delta [Oscillospiraceae bacterium]|nr:DNA polymerase III subunit delta [Oscillospiraceae bacterium]